MTTNELEEATWAVGTYTPSEAFKAIPEMACVYRDDYSRTLVATTGPSGDARSVADAHLMAAARTMRDALERIAKAGTTIRKHAALHGDELYSLGLVVEVAEAALEKARVPDSRTLGERLLAFGTARVDAKLS